MSVVSRKSGRTFAPAQPGDGVVGAPIVKLYVRMCEEQGIARDRIMAASGLGEADIDPPSGWVRQQVIESLFRGRLRVSPDPMLGLHFAARMDPAKAGLLGFMALSCPSILDMYHSLRDFGGLVSNLFTTTLLHEPGLVLWCIDFRYHDTEVNRHSTEWVLSAFAALASRLDARSVLAVRMRHAPCLRDGRPHPEYAQAFACPVLFNPAQSALVLDPQRLSRPSPNGDPLVYEALCQQARRLLEQLVVESDIAGRVRREIRILLAAGHVSRDEVCARIGISSRHLHRQLRQQGSSYQHLLDELRLEAARQQLAGAAWDPDRVSAGLGFGSAKSFARWFVAKQGATPAEYRRRFRAPGS
jgi:AraC-like DNA-binding protein